MTNYDDIINLPRHESKTHPKMSLYDRASQFAPFAALTGYGEAINEAGRIVLHKIELSSEQKEILRNKLDYINNHLDLDYSFVVFVKDEKKPGGTYESITGKIKKIDDIEKKVIFIDKSIISFDDIIKIESDEFNSYDF